MLFICVLLGFGKKTMNSQLELTLFLQFLSSSFLRCFGYGEIRINVVDFIELIESNGTKMSITKYFPIFFLV